MATKPVKPGSKNKNILLLGFLCLLIGFGSIYQFFSPMLKVARQELETTQAELEGFESEIQVLTTAKNQLDQAREEMKTLKNVDFDKVSLVYPGIEDVPGLYLQMEALMSDSEGKGIDTPTYQIGTPTIDAMQKVVHIPVTVAAVGNYANLRTFVDRLEQNLRPLTIQSINFAQSLDKETGKPSGDYSLNIAGVFKAQRLSPAYAK